MRSSVISALASDAAMFLDFPLSFPLSLAGSDLIVSRGTAMAVGPERIEARTGNMKEYPSGSSPRYTSLDMAREEEMFGVLAPSSLAIMGEAAG